MSYREQPQYRTVQMTVIIYSNCLIDHPRQKEMETYQDSENSYIHLSNRNQKVTSNHDIYCSVMKRAVIQQFLYLLETRQDSDNLYIHLSNRNQKVTFNIFFRPNRTLVGNYTLNTLLIYT